jgi:hypothetical protein
MTDDRGAAALAERLATLEHPDAALSPEPKP